MTHVAGPSTPSPRHVHRLAPPAPLVPPAPLLPATTQSPTSGYQRAERSVAEERAETLVVTRTEVAPSGIEPLSTQAVLDLRRTTAPVSRIAEAYGIAPAAVRRMLRSTTPTE